MDAAANPLVSLLSQNCRRRDGVGCGLGGVRVDGAAGVFARVVRVCMAAVRRHGEVHGHPDNGRIQQPGKPPGSHAPVSVAWFSRTPKASMLKNI